jgi:glycosyltransferase involved in cell wall biosynthesis
LPTFRKVCAPAGVRTEKREGSSFLFVGRHHKIKGLDTLIDAVIRLEHSFPNARYNLTVVGDGELTSQMKNMIDENGLGNKVTFTGKIADGRLYELYSEADCVVIPSRSESIPLVFSEALQFNKPMIVTDVGDMGVLGRRYGVARVVEKENAAALAKGMQDFIEEPFQIDPEKRNELLSLLMMENSMQKLLTVILESGAK